MRGRAAGAVLPLLVLVAAAVVSPALGVTVLVPEVVSRAVTLEREGLGRAVPVATVGVVERLDALQGGPADHAFVLAPGACELVLLSGPFPGGGFRAVVTPEEALVEYRTPRGLVRRRVAFDPGHVYLVLRSRGLRAVPVKPVRGGRELPVLLVYRGRLYEPVTYFPSPDLGGLAQRVTTLAPVVDLAGDWDLLVRVEVEGETVAFDLVSADGSGAYRVVCDLRTGATRRGSLPSGEVRRLLDLAREDLARLSGLRSGRLRDEWGLWLVVYDATEGRVLLEVAHPAPGFLRRCGPRLAELVELLRECGERAFLRWECLQLSTRAQGLGDLLERSGLAGTRAVRCLLHPWLVLGPYLLHSLGILTLAVPTLAFFKGEARAWSGGEGLKVLVLPEFMELAETLPSELKVLKWVILA
ncbi:MAG: hypothetical protein ABGY09_05305, partial [Euryarchaeota archaeon]